MKKVIFQNKDKSKLAVYFDTNVLELVIPKPEDEDAFLLQIAQTLHNAGHQKNNSLAIYIKRIINHGNGSYEFYETHSDSVIQKSTYSLSTTPTLSVKVEEVPKENTIPNFDLPISSENEPEFPLKNENFVSLYNKYHSQAIFDSAKKTAKEKALTFIDQPYIDRREKELSDEKIEYVEINSQNFTEKSHLLDERFSSKNISAALTTITNKQSKFTQSLTKMRNELISQTQINLDQIKTQIDTSTNPELKAYLEKFYQKYSAENENALKNLIVNPEDILQKLKSEAAKNNAGSQSEKTLEQTQQQLNTLADIHLTDIEKKIYKKHKEIIAEVDNLEKRFRPSNYGNSIAKITYIKKQIIKTLYQAAIKYIKHNWKPNDKSANFSGKIASINAKFWPIAHIDPETLQISALKDAYIKKINKEHDATQIKLFKENTNSWKCNLEFEQLFQKDLMSWSLSELSGLIIHIQMECNKDYIINTDALRILKSEFNETQSSLKTLLNTQTDLFIFAQAKGVYKTGFSFTETAKNIEDTASDEMSTGEKNTHLIQATNEVVLGENFISDESKNTFTTLQEKTAQLLVNKDLFEEALQLKSKLTDYIKKSSQAASESALFVKKFITTTIELHKKLNDVASLQINISTINPEINIAINSWKKQFDENAKNNKEDHAQIGENESNFNTDFTEINDAETLTKESIDQLQTYVESTKQSLDAIKRRNAESALTRDKVNATANALDRFVTLNEEVKILSAQAKEKFDLNNADKIKDIAENVVTFYKGKLDSLALDTKISNLKTEKETLSSNDKITKNLRDALIQDIDAKISTLEAAKETVQQNLEQDHVKFICHILVRSLLNFEKFAAILNPFQGGSLKNYGKSESINYDEKKHTIHEPIANLLSLCKEENVAGWQSDPVKAAILFDLIKKEILNNKSTDETINKFFEAILKIDPSAVDVIEKILADENFCSGENPTLVTNELDAFSYDRKSSQSSPKTNKREREDKEGMGKKPSIETANNEDKNGNDGDKNSKNNGSGRNNPPSRPASAIPSVPAASKKESFIRRHGGKILAVTAITAVVVIAGILSGGLVPVIGAAIAAGLGIPLLVATVAGTGAVVGTAAAAAGVTATIAAATADNIAESKAEKAPAAKKPVSVARTSVIKSVDSPKPQGKKPSDFGNKGNNFSPKQFGSRKSQEARASLDEAKLLAEVFNDIEEREAKKGLTK